MTILIAIWLLLAAAQELSEWAEARRTDEATSTDWVVVNGKWKL